MIVKNEEKTLAKAIESVNPIIDELVVVDTGSTDNTRDIAKVYGAKVISIEWNDNFGEARNVSIRNAKSDWILVLDADETIAKSDLEDVRELTHNSKYLGYVFTLRTYVNVRNAAEIQLSQGDGYAESKNFVGWVPTQATRLFRNMPELFYDDHVHEDVGNSILRLGGDKIAIVDTPIHHFGRVIRSYEERLKRSEMYIRIGHKKLRDRIKANAPKRELAIACYEIGNSHGFKGDMNKAIKYFKKAKNYDDGFRPSLSALGKAYASTGNLDLAEYYIKKALNITKERDELIASDYLTLAKIYIEKKRFKEVISALRKCLEVQPNNVEATEILGIIEGVIANICGM